MPYLIEEVDSIFEVHVSNPTSQREILQAIEELAAKDPRKERCDLWCFSDEAIVSLEEYPKIAQAIKSLCPPDMVGNKTALVVSSDLQRVAANMYRSDAADLPFEIEVFTSREDALRWLKGGSGAT